MTEPSVPPLQVFCKSIPRAGHHFLATLIYNYLGDEIKYCFNHSRCCMESPCTRPDPRRMLLHKSHDGRLSETVGADAKVIVQTREPLGQMLSEIERLKNRKADAFPIEDDKLAELWLASNFLYYKGFMARWLDPAQNVALVVDYADLLAEPAEAVALSLALFDVAPDRDRIDDIVERNRARLALNPDLDHEHREFRVRSSGRSPLLSHRIVDDYVDLFAERPRDSRLRRVTEILSRLRRSEFVSPSEVAALDNRYLQRQLEHALPRR